MRCGLRLEGQLECDRRKLHVVGIKRGYIAAHQHVLFFAGSEMCVRPNRSKDFIMPPRFPVESPGVSQLHTVKGNAEGNREHLEARIYEDDPRKYCPGVPTRKKVVQHRR